ncbi:7-cyano-7-deazaguanine synthase QueC [Panacagrimonas sp.]|uniref:7-cyano-7-deazaguanine synthase QueC n=1 Tax=Panacagrimonas sp. TaxID=2480088 RepID=UPI003B52716D
MEPSPQIRRAIVLLSGGLDSATVLAMAREQGYETHTLAVAYGQRHLAEVRAAERVAQRLQAATHRLMQVDLAQLGGSALTDPHIEVPNHPTSGIPATYVPARNTLFLSLALGCAEVLGAQDLFIGVNAVDYSGYPDCRPEFIESFQNLAQLATRTGTEGGRFRVHAPLIHLSKAQIVAEGVRLRVDYAETVSCYRADDQGRACGRCDSCRLRAQGFREAGVADPTRYRDGRVSSAP